jgi:D-arabinitol dehydrogenase (NADP+)
MTKLKSKCDLTLLLVTCCGICGTDGHIHEGEFIAKFPLIPGHEAIGKVVEMGKNVKGFEIGDRCVADVGISVRDRFSKCIIWTMSHCLDSAVPASIAVVATNFFVRTLAPRVSLWMAVLRNISNSKSLMQPLYSRNFHCCLHSPQKKVYKIHNLSDEDSTLLEPAACAIHGLDKLNPQVGIEVLLLGAGPTGLILAQLLKLNGASKVVIAANKGIKMDIAKNLDAGDEYIELDRQNPQAQWAKLKQDNPYGFDVVVEATGVEKLANESINYVRRGGTLMIYGVYEDKALVHWPPSKIFGDEIKVRFL